MKNFTLILFLISLIGYSFPISAATPASSRHHDGFYFSFGIGPAFGHIDDSYYLKATEEKSSMDITGTPVAVDIRLGGAIKQDLVLSFDMVGRSMSSPELKMNEGSYATDKNLTISETTYGLGVTKFFMPYNFYAGATVGTGVFMFTYGDVSDENSTSVRSDYGFSWMLRTGKSWYLGERWGLGAGLAYGNTTTHTQDGTGKEDLYSSQFIATVTVSYQ